MSNARISRVIEIEPTMTLKEFGRALLARLWEIIEVDCERYRQRRTLDGMSWTWFRSDAQRLVLGAWVANCRGDFEGPSPARRRWESLSLFVGPNKGFQVEISEDQKHVVLVATPDMMHVFGFERKTVSPFELKPFGARTKLTPMSQMHWPLRDDSIAIPTIKDIGKTSE